MKTLILGLGNPILSDDSVGLHVADRLGDLIAEAQVVTTHLVGLNLLETLQGYDRLYLVDACLSDGKPGEAWKRLPDGRGALHLFTSHGLDFWSLMELGRTLGLNMPKAIMVYGVEIKTPFAFGEGLSPELNSKVPRLAEEIAYDIRSIEAL
ncbi:MAG: hydrogenase maturation protease [Deltaproteobacteria bacterium]|nr:hydrogenase maturation protease [Deltaproteobacteria bacterium]